MKSSREIALLPSVLEAIGNTPMVELSRITRDLEGRIIGKLEYLNPGYSKKDRIALQMIEEAEANGSLQPGQTVVELTSGNTGTGLAIVCAVKGHPRGSPRDWATPTDVARPQLKLLTSCDPGRPS